MVYLLAVAAALANALTSVLQRMGVEDAPQESTLRLSLMAHALRRGVWLAGFLLMVLSFLAQAVALHLGELTSVQPILTTELLFLVVVLVVWFHIRVGLTEWVAAVAAAAGLAGFLLFAQPGPGTVVPDGTAWIAVGVSCGGAVAIAVGLTRFGPRWWRAAMFGTAGAIGFAFTASLTEVVTGFVARDWVTIFLHWQTYILAVTGVLSVFLAQNAYHAGPIAASQSTLVIVDPLVSILIGIALFGDQLRTAEPWGALEAASLLVLFAGTAILAHSPLVSGVKGDESGYEEMLSSRGRARVARELGVALATEQSVEPDEGPERGGHGKRHDQQAEGRGSPGRRASAGGPGDLEPQDA